MAAIYTVFRHRSHAHDILENFLAPYYFRGQLTDPGMEVVSFYADQTAADGDMTGLANMTARMLKDGGAGRWSSKDLLAKVETLGGDLAIEVGPDSTVLSLAATAVASSSTSSKLALPQ